MDAGGSKRTVPGRSSKVCKNAAAPVPLFTEA